MMLVLPSDAELVDLARPERAVTVLADLLGRMRNVPSIAAETEMLAREMIDETVRGGGYLLAVLPDGAVLTGATVPGAAGWDGEHANALRWHLEDQRHETIAVRTAIGPVVVAERRTAELVQLQAFLAEPGAAGMLVLTLSGRSPRNWHRHRAELLRMIETARRTPAE